MQVQESFFVKLWDACAIEITPILILKAEHSKLCPIVLQLPLPGFCELPVWIWHRVGSWSVMAMGLNTHSCKFMRNSQTDKSEGWSNHACMSIFWCRKTQTSAKCKVFKKTTVMCHISNAQKLTTPIFFFFFFLNQEDKKGTCDGHNS